MNPRATALLLCFVAFAATAVDCSDESALQPTVSVTVIAADGTHRTIDSCSTSSCVLLGGQDRLQIGARYEGVTLPKDASLTLPKLTILADGKPLSDLPPFTQVGLDPRTFLTSALTTPRSEVTSLTVLVDGASGYSGELSGFSVTAPVLALQIAECMNGCMLRQGVGQIHILVSGWLAPGTSASVETSIDDVPQGLQSMPKLDGDGSEPARGVLVLPVPSRGANWTIRVSAAGTKPVDTSVMLAPLGSPDLSLSIAECKSQPCSLPAGSSVTLVVSAPKETQAKEATLRVLKNGIYDPTPITAPLDLVEGDLRKAVAVTTLPTQVGVGVRYRAYVGEATPVEAPAITTQ